MRAVYHGVREIMILRLDGPYLLSVTKHLQNHDWVSFEMELFL
jgi:hypothetical protein